MEQAGSTGSKTSRPAATLTLALSMLLAALGTSIANIAMPVLAEAFSAPFAQVQAVVVAYLAALTVCVVVAGRLGDRHGLKPVLVAGLAVFAAASLLCALAPTLWLLIGARALQGAGAAVLMTLAMALMRQSVHGARAGRAMGLLGTVSALGTALGPALGGLLIPLTGWRGIFWVQVPLAVLALILAITTLPADPAREKAPSAGRRPVMSRALASGLAVNVVVAAVMMTTLVVGPFQLGLGLGLTTAHVGLVMTVGPVISIASGVPSGRLVDAWGAGRVLAAGLALLAMGAFLLAFLPNGIGVAGYVLAILVLTPGYQLFQAANNTAALADVAADQRGTVSGLLGLSRNIGLMAGASAMGAVFAFGVGTDELARAAPSDIAAGMRLTFLLAGAMMLAAIGIAARYRRSG
ncbi:MFS transporter [Methylobrevis pamukkalensis]|uniref:Multidrug resistance protein MdtL n=1 Tax=Methylobrevis pamukkalensis TaxID=1439726 RepID=A0A1E3H2T7_9HYPH|nr:MFS transporter [Methylobrevis pamukkalensis]ODN70637.1 Multidrug resistance protein MdtL [Methylobrevis pamukkalensis]